MIKLRVLISRFWTLRTKRRSTGNFPNIWSWDSLYNHVYFNSVNNVYIHSFHLYFGSFVEQSTWAIKVWFTRMCNMYRNCTYTMSDLIIIGKLNQRKNRGDRTHTFVECNRLEFVSTCQYKRGYWGEAYQW